MNKKITVTVAEDGTTDIDLSGFHGKGCQRVLDDFLAGETPSVVRVKPEYFEALKTGVKQNA